MALSNHDILSSIFAHLAERYAPPLEEATFDLFLRIDNAEKTRWRKNGRRFTDFEPRNSAAWIGDLALVSRAWEPVARRAFFQTVVFRAYAGYSSSSALLRALRSSRGPWTSCVRQLLILDDIKSAIGESWRQWPLGVELAASTLIASCSNAERIFIGVIRRIGPSPVQGRLTSSSLRVLSMHTAPDIAALFAALFELPLLEELLIVTPNESLKAFPHLRLTPLTDEPSSQLPNCPHLPRLHSLTLCGTDCPITADHVRAITSSTQLLRTLALSGGLPLSVRDAAECIDRFSASLRSLNVDLMTQSKTQPHLLDESILRCKQLQSLSWNPGAGQVITSEAIFERLPSLPLRMVGIHNLQLSKVQLFIFVISLSQLEDLSFWDPPYEMLDEDWDELAELCEQRGINLECDPDEYNLN